MFEHFTREEIAAVKASSQCQKFLEQKHSAITIADVITAINAIVHVPGENLGPLKYLLNLREVLAMDSVGREHVLDKNSDTVLAMMLSGEFFANAVTTWDANYYHRLGFVELTVAGGAGGVAATNIKSGIADYYGVVRIRSVITNKTCAAMTLSFTDATPVACNGLPGGNVILNATANIMDISLKDQMVYSGNDNKNIRVAVATAPAMADGDKIVINYTSWYET